MLDHDIDTGYTAALSDFQRARSRAQLSTLLERFTGSSRRLLSYEDVRQLLRLPGGIERGLKDIPLDAIVGSVGRYTDFTRDFLPLRESTRDRWVRIKVAASGLVGLPPIEAYQIGNVYFVKDGNHRVSVARQLGAKTIQGYVTEVLTHAPLNPDVQPDDLIRIAEFNQFLETTRLDHIRPDADLTVTIPGGYPILLNHIDLHRYYMGLEYKRDISYPEAVEHWYDTIYLPLVETIRNLGILHRFSSRTETDLYLWLTEHQAQLEAELGAPVRPEFAAGSLVEARSPEVDNLLSRLGNRLLDLMIPDKLGSGPPPGSWRSQTSSLQTEDYLFADVLVPVNGKEDGWCALEQAFVLVRREGSHLHALHVIRDPSVSDSEIEAVRAEFEERCQAAQIEATFVVAQGEVAEQTVQRAALNDLVIVNVSYPPAAQPLARLASGFRDLISRCSRPVLATPQTVSPLKRPLLAFDGSPKAREALYIATYLAGKWKTPLMVVTVDQGEPGQRSVLDSARQYLSTHGVDAEYQLAGGPVAGTLLRLAENGKHDLILMGGYGHGPVLEMVLSSTVNEVLRESSVPVLICR